MVCFINVFILYPSYLDHLWTQYPSNDHRKCTEYGYQDLLTSLQTVSGSNSESESGSELETEFEAKLSASPGEFTLSKTRSKEWWVHLKQDLEKETEKQILQETPPATTPKQPSYPSSAKV